MRIKYLLTLLALISFVSAAAQQFESWRIINIPDYHNAEGFARNTPERARRIQEQTEQFKRMKERHGGELIVMPGDCNGGHWYRDKFMKPFKSNPEYAQFSTEEVILEASRLCYGGLWDIVHNGGYKHFLMAVGDHELGDNPWRKGSEVSKHISTFRKGFANTITLDENGQSRFNTMIGKAMARPVGTKYEHTSNAIQYKNVLFVTLDMFRFDDEYKILGNQGVINGDIDGKHLQWFESVLSEAQHIPSIQHIVVQSHLPIIYPVRKYASSGMLVDKKESEKILNVLRKYKVDLYLAGEVHMNTVTRDTRSDLIQLVARGNNLTNVTLVDVEEDKLLINTYHQNGDKLGSLSIVKESDKTDISGTGLLTPITPMGLQIHWSFDELLSQSNYSNSIDGTFPKPGKHNPVVSGIKEPVAFLNDGGFNFDYSLIGGEVTTAEGRIGNAAVIKESSCLSVLPIGPMEAGYERSLSCWVKTTAKERRLIFNSASYWGQGQFFNLSINEGNLELAVRPEMVMTTENQHLNDGQWHHLAVVMPHDDAKLGELKLFIDGQVMEEIQCSRPDIKIHTSQANWMSIATQSTPYKTDLARTMNMKKYIGLLDDFSIWTRALSDEEVLKLYNEGLEGNNALSVENELKIKESQL
ncbi:LamG-like jellyroll fold domain-containing protein [Carboxylicivirga sp. RSCT41]|uniref:LamG-like jellyroll fold domain-containing protein n=1 Tax=Carboxylicivirga agarovorans TaxID=3417570 RepID=UPI003D336A65